MFGFFVCLFGFCFFGCFVGFLFCFLWGLCCLLLLLFCCCLVLGFFVLFWGMVRFFGVVVFVVCLLMRLSQVTVAGKFPIRNFSFPMVSVYPSWYFQASPLGAILLDCIFHIQHLTVDIQNPRDKHASVPTLLWQPISSTKSWRRFFGWIGLFLGAQTPPAAQRRSLRKKACLHSLLSKG